MSTNRSIVRSALAALVLLVGAAGAVSAQEISQSHLNAALAAVKTASPSAENYDRRLPLASEEVQNVLIRGRPDLYQVIAEVVNAEALKLAPRRRELDVEMAKVWAEFFTEDELNSITGLHTIRDRVLAVSGKKNPTVHDFITYSGRGQLHNPWVGSPKEVADMFEEYFTAGACDGFVISATYVPGTYEDFVTLVVPELQRRGLFQKEYKGATLRENLGLERPAVGKWRHVKRGA